MPSIITIAFGTIVATYVFFRVLMVSTQDEREPQAIETNIPFLGPMIGIAREKSSFYRRLRDDHHLPIYTLRLPFMRMYIVNSTELIPVLQRYWRTISFSALAIDAGRIIGMSRKAIDTMERDLTSKDGFSASWPKYIAAVMGPGEDLDSMNRRSTEIYAAEMERLRAQGASKIGLWQWSRQMMVVSTTEAVWGPQNPFRDPAIAEAWRVFESGFLTLNLIPFPSLLAPKYMYNGGYKTASGLVRKRWEHHSSWGFTKEDMGRGELGNAFAVLGNSTPCALWVLYHILSDDAVLAQIRGELSALVQHEKSGDINVKSLDLAREVLRFRAVNPGPRVLLEDVDLNGFLLKKGSRLMIPAPVQHTDTSAWGTDAREFDHMRFVPVPGRKKPCKVAFRAFGGGHVLCPGRHFASTEILALAALLILQFDVTPSAGKWIEPTWRNSPLQAGFPVPDDDISIELTPRESVAATKWHVTFSGSDNAMEIVTEDTVSDVNT
ncbi:cytochrome P450 [Xylaria arbuscula]|nr:cytochrome P450 [Xylaria arbuscula]